VLANRRETILGNDFAIGASEMRCNNNFSGPFKDKADCRQGTVDAMCFGDFSIGYGNIKVDTEKNRLAA
jgi:hypothetical protein